MKDFTNLISEIQHNKRASDILLIDREEGSSDDFAHACNFACLALWMAYNAYPRLNSNFNYTTVQEMADSADMLSAANKYSAEAIEAMLRQVGAVV